MNLISHMIVCEGMSQTFHEETWNSIRIRFDIDIGKEPSILNVSKVFRKVEKALLCPFVCALGLRRLRVTDIWLYQVLGAAFLSREHLLTVVIEVVDVVRSHIAFLSIFVDLTQNRVNHFVLIINSLVKKLDKSFQPQISFMVYTNSIYLATYIPNSSLW